MISYSGNLGSAVISGRVMGEIQVLFGGLELKVILLLVVHCQGLIILVTQTDSLSNGLHCIGKTSVGGACFPGTIFPGSLGGQGVWGQEGSSSNMEGRRHVG